MIGCKALLEGLKYEHISGNIENMVSKVVYDSRKIEKDCMFICIKGANFDGHQVAAEAVRKGAACVVIEKMVDLPEEYTSSIIKVEDTRYAMAFIAANYFEHPAERLTVIGITGTKGKTTTAYLIKSILEQAGKKVGLIGTIETIIGKEHIKSKNTTPESYLLQETFFKMAEAGIDTVVMEVSSQGLMLHRTQGFIFDYGIFTNLEPDHIGPNEHSSFEQYLYCKSLLMKSCKIGIVNANDPHVSEIIKNCSCEIRTYGIKGEINYLKGRNIDYQAEKMQLVRERGYIGVSFEVNVCNKQNLEEKLPVIIPTPGKFSIYNALAAVSICYQFGVINTVVQKAIASARVKGRIELVHVSDEFTLMIDYAHNAMALESLLSTLREYHPHRLITLFGCGGNRSRDRRFEMGEVSGRLSDFTIITSDNPRYEDPLAIMKDIETGIKKTEGNYIMIADRKDAIRYAIQNGEVGDIIVLAGKGHEDYQEIKGVKYPLDERVLIQEILKE